MSDKDVSLKLSIKDGITGAMDQVSSNFAAKLATMGLSIELASKVWEVFSDVIKDSIHEFSEQQAAVWGTKVALEGLGSRAKITVEDVEKLTQTYAKQMGVQDDWVQKGINKAIQANANLDYQQINQLIPTATALAKIQGEGKVTSEKLSEAMVQLAQAGEYPERALRMLKQTGMGLTDQQNEQITTLIKSGDTAEGFTLILGYLQERTKGVLEANEGLNESSQKLGVAWAEFVAPAGKVIGTVLDETQKALTLVLQLIPKVQEAYVSWGRSILEWLHIAKKSHEDYSDSVEKQLKAETSARDKFQKAQTAADAAIAKKKEKELKAENEQLADIQKKADEKAKQENDARVDAIMEANQISYEVAKRQSAEYYAFQEMSQKAAQDNEIANEVGRQNALDDLAQLANSKNRVLFEIGKQASAAQAGISAAEGAMKAFSALAGIPYIGPVLGAAAAAVLIAYGVEQVANIESQQFPAAANQAYAPGDGATARFGEAGNPEWIMNQGGIKALAKEASGGGTQTIILQMDKQTLQTWIIKSDQQRLTMKRQGQV